jgi:hypothetical protein
MAPIAVTPRAGAWTTTGIDAGPPAAAGQQQAALAAAGGLYRSPDVGRAALIDALVRNALRGVPADELQRQALHNKLSGWALRVLGSHLTGSGPVLGDAGSVVQAMKQLLRQEQRDADAGRCAGARSNGPRPHASPRSLSCTVPQASVSTSLTVAATALP